MCAMFKNRMKATCFYVYFCIRVSFKKNSFPEKLYASMSLITTIFRVYLVHDGIKVPHLLMEIEIMVLCNNMYVIIMLVY